MGFRLLPDKFLIKFFANSPGGFFVFGVLIAVTYLIQDQQKLRKSRKAAAIKAAALKKAAAIREAELNKEAASKPEQAAAQNDAAVSPVEAGTAMPPSAPEGTEHGTV